MALAKHVVLSSLLFIYLWSFALSACPHSDATLIKFSSVSSWNVPNAVVVIAANQRVLLDKSPPTLKSLNISGEFVIDNKNINVSVNWIRVNYGGKFIAGSSDCQITSKVIFNFYGSRSLDNSMGFDTDGAPFGTKGIAVATGASLELHGYNSGPSWTRISATARANSSFVLVDDSVKWVPGDVVVLASTDFSEVVDTTTYPSSWSSVSWARGTKFPEQTEELIVKSVSGNNVSFTSPLGFTHWGSGLEKAEIGLLTRRIVFQGDNDSLAEEFGGHLIMRHLINLRIEGVEFRRFGQKGVLARYPVHFHLLRDAIGKGFYIKHSSIHHNFQRCLVLHESHGILVQNMVGYHTFGHMFFLEDGGEHNNTIDRVLGINAYPVPAEEIKFGIKTQVIPTDNSPSIFWITNPDNTIINNVAVGGRFGFWFLMAKQVNGLARILFYQGSTYNPRTQEIGNFYNNVAHGSVDTGFELDGFMDEFGVSTDSGSYSPKYIFSNLTAYKCRHFGIWGKSSMSFTRVNLLDNRRGFMVNGVTHLYNSYIVGETDNIGLPRKNHARSYPDLGTSNTTKICGHESYDNGGPQYSYNNVFVNFVSTATRKAGALCPLQTGPFMLDTENRLFNLTFINANRFHIGSPLRGDNEHGWTVLDIDGSSTGIKGGGWIVSQNATHLLTPNCSYRADWEAYMCPVFAEGYVQLTIVNQITNVMDVMSLSGANLTGTFNSTTRNYRGVFYEQKSSQRFGRVLGATLDCANGIPDSCYQYMHNVMPRKFHTFKFLAGEKNYVKTPSYLTVNMHSAMPGDYVYLSIPYPPSAVPFNITQNNLPVVRVTSINSLNATTYYYDNNTELLYLFLKNPSNSFSLRGYLNLSDYGSNAPTYHIRAACTECKPTLSKVKNVYSPPSLSRKEEIYYAKLENCQVKASSRPTGGSGEAFFWFYPATRELHFNINHDITVTATKIILGVGKFNQFNYTIATKEIKSATSPSRGLFVLSLAQWADLVKGNLFVQVYSQKYPTNGQLRGQIQCTGTCSTPPAVPAVNACVPTGKSLYIFNDLPHSNMTIAPGSDNTTTTISTSALCGNASARIYLRKSIAMINSGYRKTILINFSTYKFFEFSVRVVPGYGELPLYVYLMNDNTTIRSATLRVEGTYIPGNYLLDEYSGWQRVKIPVADFQMPSPVFNLTRIAFGLYDTNNFKDFYVDEVRFVAGGTEPTKPLVNATEIQYYNPSICSV